MNEVDTFQNLGVYFAVNWRMDAELNLEVRKCAEVLIGLEKNRNISMKTKSRKE